MRVAITGASGFVGRHLAARLTSRPHPDEVVAVSRRDGVAIDDVGALVEAFAGCEVVAHCAGINRELGDQTYERVHVAGTRAVIDAARRAGVSKVILLSFLRARPGSDSPYHESKWAAEELVRASGLDFTVLKAGMIYGRGDHLLDHLSHTVYTAPLFASVGLREKPIRPIPVDDMVDVLEAAVHGRLTKSTVRVVGAEELMLSDAVRRVARLTGRRVLVLSAPVAFHRVLAQVTEWTMKVPLVAKAQVRMLAEGVVDATPGTSELPDDLRPRRMFTDDQIRSGLPQPGGFGWRDLRVAR